MPDRRDERAWTGHLRASSEVQSSLDELLVRALFSIAHCTCVTWSESAARPRPPHSPLASSHGGESHATHAPPASPTHPTTRGIGAPPFVAHVGILHILQWPQIEAATEFSARMRSEPWRALARAQSVVGAPKVVPIGSQHRARAYEHKVGTL